MKKYILLLLISCLFGQLQAQKNTALSTFETFCNDCASGDTDNYNKLGCRGFNGICGNIETGKPFVISRTGNSIERISFAHKNESGDTQYGFTAKLEVMTKKGEVLYTSMIGNMHYLTQEGTLYRIMSTQQEEFAERKLEHDQAVLFSYGMLLTPEAKAKLVVKATVYRIDLSNRELVEVASFEQKI